MRQSRFIVEDDLKLIARAGESKLARRTAMTAIAGRADISDELLWSIRDVCFWLEDDANKLDKED